MSTEIADKLRYEGAQIILPADPEKMTFKAAHDTLTRIEKEEETTIQIHEIVDAFPLEGAYAMIQAMREIYGWATPLHGGFFQVPPTTVSLEVGYRKTVQVIWGRFAVPNIEGEFQSSYAEHQGRICFAINGKVKKKHMPDVKRLADRTRAIVIEQSIYRGQALRLEVDESGDLNYHQGPAFLDLSHVRPDEMVFTEALTDEILTNIFTPIEHTAACRAAQIPLKRGALLEGPYGCGKTLIAYVTAEKAVLNGWTFIMLNRVSGLPKALEFARRYAPAVVFAEDIDRSISGEDRTEEIDDVLNEIDGLDAKAHEIMVILTSNHADKISRAMLRPGRLDAVISITPPDAQAAERLIRLYARTTLAADADVSVAATEMAGRIPAVIREVVERAKLYGISRGRLSAISADDLAASARQMTNHLCLLDGPSTVVKSVEERLGIAMRDLVQRAGIGSGDELEGVVHAAHGANNAANNAARHARTARDNAESATNAAGAALQETQGVKADTEEIKREVAAVKNAVI